MRILGSIIIVFLWVAYMQTIWSPDAKTRDEQGKVLAGIEHMHDARVSAFVDEWQKIHTSPGASDVASLRILAERIQADPAQAVAYTADVKAKAKADAIDWNGWAPILVSIGLGIVVMFVLGRMGWISSSHPPFGCWLSWLLQPPLLWRLVEDGCGSLGEVLCGAIFVASLAAAAWFFSPHIAL